jgi:hypothetical protein
MGTVAPVQSDREIRKNMAQSAQVNESQSGSWHAVSRVATFWLRVALTLAFVSGYEEKRDLPFPT